MCPYLAIRLTQQYSESLACNVNAHMKHPITLSEGGLMPYISLRRFLELKFSSMTYSFCILTIECNNTIAIRKVDRDSFKIFDSHSRGNQGDLTSQKQQCF